MAARGGGEGFAAEHTGDFFHPFFGGEYADAADGLLALAVFPDLPMLFAAGRHLG